MLRTLVGTPFYLSPELCDDKPYNSAADMWAIGVCLVRSPHLRTGFDGLSGLLNTYQVMAVQYELCMGKHPFTAQNEGALIRKIMRGDYEKPTGYSKDLLGVVMACLAYDHKNRPSAATLLARPAVNKKAHALHILPLAPVKRPSLLQLPAQPVQMHATDNDPTAAPGHVQRSALVEKPATNQAVQERHPFAREGTMKQVVLPRA